jgi:hypothetical protein
MPLAQEHTLSEHSRSVSCVSCVDSQWASLQIVWARHRPQLVNVGFSIMYSVSGSQTMVDKHTRSDVALTALEPAGSHVVPIWHALHDWHSMLR